ncbi:hypothetical protein MHB75_09345 [Kurthia sp. FSL E2-0154]|uniref:hypothetical protein n=1 Tax=Kurthia sp. FSL E2-0154 TaxID=2921358 RepID=UPI0030F7F017
MMKTTSDSIKLVIFNNCFSNGQAEAITEHIDCAIGMNKAVYDDAGREFVAQFYSAIPFGNSVQNAFGESLLKILK